MENTEVGVDEKTNEKSALVRQGCSSMSKQNRRCTHHKKSNQMVGFVGTYIWKRGTWEIEVVRGVYLEKGWWLC